MTPPIFLIVFLHVLQFFTAENGMLLLRSFLTPIHNHQAVFFFFYFNYHLFEYGRKMLNT